MIRGARDFKLYNVNRKHDKQIQSCRSGIGFVEKSGEMSNFFELDLNAILAYASEIRLAI